MAGERLARGGATGGVRGDTPHEGGAQGPASEQERPQRCPRDRADDAGRVVQTSACEDLGEPTRADAADIAQAAARQAAGYGERAARDLAQFWAQGGGRQLGPFRSQGQGAGGGASASGRDCRPLAGGAASAAGAVGTAPQDGPRTSTQKPAVSSLDDGARGGTGRGADLSGDG